jgi:photosystem II S4 domain protein
MLPKDKILKGTENPEEITRIIDLAEQAIKTWEVVCTDFLSPPVAVEAQEKFSPLTDIQFVLWGGYAQAERTRFAVTRAELPLDVSQVPIAALDVSGNFLFDTATHRDFLGSVLGTGVVRQKIGDIVVLGERGAQILVVPELVPFLEANLTQVRSVPVKTQEISLEELKIRPPKKKEMTTVEASMRLDAVASAAFRMSRSKMADAIAQGNVRVNWKPIHQASHPLKEGDLIAVQGKGRAEVGEVSVTKKQRYRVQLTRYI